MSKDGTEASLFPLRRSAAHGKVHSEQPDRRWRDSQEPSERNGTYTGRTRPARHRICTTTTVCEVEKDGQDVVDSEATPQREVRCDIVFTGMDTYGGETDKVGGL